MTLWHSSSSWQKPPSKRRRRRKGRSARRSTNTIRTRTVRPSLRRRHRMAWPLGGPRGHSRAHPDFSTEVAVRHGGYIVSNGAVNPETWESRTVTWPRAVLQFRPGGGVRQAKFSLILSCQIRRPDHHFREARKASSGRFNNIVSGRVTARFRIKTSLDFFLFLFEVAVRPKHESTGPSAQRQCCLVRYKAF